MSEREFTAAREFTIVREFDAPRAMVFRAWTDPEQVAKWSAPEGMSALRSSVKGEVRPGGAYASTMVRDGTGETFAVSGRYLEVVEPERLVFTWRDPTGASEATGECSGASEATGECSVASEATGEFSGDGSSERESVITVTFAERAGKTTMTFHLRAPGPLSVEDGARVGWSQTFDKLAVLLRV
jgi:uncharacterized protein YndB with AHSA1/START domain